MSITWSTEPDCPQPNLIEADNEITVLYRIGPRVTTCRMSEELRKKKRIRSGHRGSATKTITKVTELLAAEKVDLTRLASLKLSLKEKLDTIKLLDEEILNLVDEARLEDEIEEADAFRQGHMQERRAQAAINPAPTARPLGGGELSASERPSCHM